MIVVNSTSPLGEGDFSAPDEIEEEEEEEEGADGGGL
jgi:hypothetical protein